ncbi:redoxin domain-containing protein [Gluconacetobacter aggeris]|uniref:Redoxin domain-containing protein n=1 Tax=Gluconacetobacter aggeris TaxID=1286186 RepID=A0A7W4IQG6_9PROT|nr:redoxin domain-containing protein [Gluconacetobacter aggeris]MBB2167122.1 redoxin domain-containing protein [Gluconacetobacter aggeris]
MNRRFLAPGDPAPWFTQRCTTPSGRYSFDMAAGRYNLLYFFPSAAGADIGERLEHLAGDPVFDGVRCQLFGVSADSDDELSGRLHAQPPGVRHFLDADRLVAGHYGVPAGGRGLVLVDPMLRIAAIADDEPSSVRQVLSFLRHLPDALAVQRQVPTPALMLPGVLEPALCEMLIRYFHGQASVQSAIFTEPEPGRSLPVTDIGFKSRRDCVLRDPALVAQLQHRVIHRIVPEISKYFQFQVTRMERMIVACYDAADHGCFGPHRDNTVTATAHRRFAVSINLNDDFEGGGLSFPEIGPARYTAPLGGATVFSCSVLHAVAPVTRGCRYACLPFLHDAPGAARA